MRASRVSALAIAVTALTLTACGGSAAAQPASNAANVRVCQHYRTQRTHVKNLAEPSLTDAIQFETWVALDAQQATPGTPVARDLGDLSRAQRDTNGPQSAVYDASTRVLTDCGKLGIKFQS